MILYHSTNAENVGDIRKNGFRAGYGDCYEGVYFWDNVYDAVGYSGEGSEQSLTRPVVLTVKTSKALPCGAILGGFPPEWSDDEKEQHSHIYVLPARAGNRVKLRILDDAQAAPVDDVGATDA